MPLTSVFTIEPGYDALSPLQEPFTRPLA